MFIPKNLPCIQYAFVVMSDSTSTSFVSTGLVLSETQLNNATKFIVNITSFKYLSMFCRGVEIDKKAQI